MKYFKQVNLPKADYYGELNRLIDSGTIQWNQTNQICINTIASKPDDIYFGTGSLNYDWANAVEVDGKIEVPEFEKKYTDLDFDTLCTQFKGTLFEEIYNTLSVNHKIGRMRLMKSAPQSTLSWHRDRQIRLHYPLKTQDGCFMIIEDETVHLEKDTWYLTNTVYRHTAINSSMEDRIHLVINILDTYNNFSVDNYVTKEITTDEVLVAWEKLWPARTDNLLMSDMHFNGGFDSEISKKYTPTHWGVFDGDKLIAVGSGHKTTDIFYRGRGIWVDPEYRMQGLSQRIWEAVANQAKKEQCSFLWALPNVDKAKHCLSFGFKQTSAPSSWDYGQNIYALFDLDDL